MTHEEIGSLAGVLKAVQYHASDSQRRIIDEARRILVPKPANTAEEAAPSRDTIASGATYGTIGSARFDAPIAPKPPTIHFHLEGCCGGRYVR